MPSPDKLIASILKHDSKQNTYKIALIRAINDIVLAYPDMLAKGQDVAIPLRMLARHWIAYYWSFVEHDNPIYQGIRNQHDNSYRQDMAFRTLLTQLRQQWEALNQTDSSASDGFLLTTDLLVPRKRLYWQHQSHELVRLYERTLRKVMNAIEQPIQYAGTDLDGHFSVFRPLARYINEPSLAKIPGTHDDDRCIVISAEMWQAFQSLSLWVEALCIQEWSLFVQTIDQKDRTPVRSGEVFELLTQRPDNRVPLTWERNRILILLEEGITFTCAWSHQAIRRGDAYDLDHLIPVSVYPMNELWNLVPTHPAANNRKRDLIPTPDLLERAITPLIETYQNYHQHIDLKPVLIEDSLVRFSMLDTTSQTFSQSLAGQVVNFMEQVADSRSLARVEGF